MKPSPSSARLWKKKTTDETTSLAEDINIEAADARTSRAAKRGPLPHNKYSGESFQKRKIIPKGEIEMKKNSKKLRQACLAGWLAGLGASLLAAPAIQDKTLSRQQTTPKGTKTRRTPAQTSRR
jgi:hypothetical protein